jgi:ABC-type transporter Mla subunit MlaD
MKTFKLILLTSFIFCILPLLEAQSVEVPSAIITALNNGDAGQLSNYLNTNVELFIENKNDVFSKQQSTQIIADFFRKNHVTSFQLLHKGNKDAASFVIGTLKTSSGNFRLYVLTRKNEIQQLRIEPSND